MATISISKLVSDKGIESYRWKSISNK